MRAIGRAVVTALVVLVAPLPACSGGAADVRVEPRPAPPPPTSSAPDTTADEPARPPTTAIPEDEEDEDVPAPAVLVAFGAEFVLDSYSGADLGLRIVGVDEDADAAVVAAGAYPAETGSTWAVVRLQLTNYSTATEYPDLYAELVDGDFRDSDYGCPTEEWWTDPTYATLLGGGTVEGTWCFMPTDALSTDARLEVEDGAGDRIAFALFPEGGGEAQDPPPDRPDPGGAGPGSFATPLAAGTALEADGWELTVRAASAAVPAAPGARLPAGWVVVGVHLDVAYDGDQPFEATYAGIGLVDDRRVVVWPTTDTGSTAGCEAGPVLTLPTFVPPGFTTGTAGRYLCFTVPEAAVASSRLAAFFGTEGDADGFLALP